MKGLQPRAVGAVAVAVVSVGLVVFGAGAVVRLLEMRREMTSMERDLVSLRTRSDDLTRLVDRLRNDPAYVEKLAREDLGNVRPGETILKFPSGGRGGESGGRGGDPPLDSPDRR